MGFLRAGEGVNGEPTITILNQGSSYPADGWRSIKTAPKDGTKILAWDASDKRYVVALWETYYDGGKWLVPDSAEGECFPVGVTHWMPLPEPPK